MIRGMRGARYICLHFPGSVPLSVSLRREGGGSTKGSRTMKPSGRRPRSPEAALGSRAVPLGLQLRPELAAGLAREEVRPTRRRPCPLNRKRTAALNRAGCTLVLPTLPPPLVLLQVVLALALSTVLRPLAAVRGRARCWPRRRPRRRRREHHHGAALAAARVSSLSHQRHR